VSQAYLCSADGTALPIRLYW